MISTNRIPGGAAMLALVFVSAPAFPQGVVVTSGDEKVVVEGDFVRIRDGKDKITIGDAWRKGGKVEVQVDTERILVDLGAVTSGDRIQMNLAGDILFPFDSSEIRPQATAQLSKVAAVIRARSVGEVHVIGHTDARGSHTHNQKLSRERALAVMRWIQSNEGIPFAVMVGSGVGSKYPVAPNATPEGRDDPEGRARNRRVEIQLATREGVKVGPGVIEIRPGSVTVGNVKVDPGGVSIGGIHVDTGGRDQTQECAAGETCKRGCPDGNCQMTCNGGAVCNFGCSGGNCEMTCASGAVCDFSCSGGGCRFACPTGATCRRVTCSGEGCACTGPGC